MPLTVTFWGVRGSIATPQACNLGVGGNTSCVAVQDDARVLLLDAGTGIKNCGRHLVSTGDRTPHDIWILFSHFHWDHLQGLPSFEPLFRPEFRLHLVSSVPVDLLRIRLQRLMEYPYFPISWEESASEKMYYSVPAAGMNISGLQVLPIQLHHPQGATGYGIAGAGGSLVYASDFEHGDPECDALLQRFARDSDLLIYDAQYTPQEYVGADRKGWGHSTWQEGVRLAQAANVRRLALFHHDPDHTDDVMLNIQEEARLSFPGTDVATEGNSLIFG